MAGAVESSLEKGRWLRRETVWPLPVERLRA